MAWPLPPLDTVPATLLTVETVPARPTPWPLPLPLPFPSPTTLFTSEVGVPRLGGRMLPVPGVRPTLPTRPLTVWHRQSPSPPTAGICPPPPVSAPVMPPTRGPPAAAGAADRAIAVPATRM